MVQSFNEAKEGLMYGVLGKEKISHCGLIYDWVGKGPLFLEDGVQIDSEQMELKVQDIIDGHRAWNFSSLKYPLPEKISHLTIGMPLGLTLMLEMNLFGQYQRREYHYETGV